MVSLSAALVVAAVLALPGTGLTQVVTLNDGNSSVDVDLGSSAGMYSWYVDGISHLNSQWFWFRLNNGLAAPINSLGAPTYTASGNTLQATYSGVDFCLGIEYVLSGGANGSGISQILESIRVTNHWASPLDFHLFQYSDFNLGGSPGGDNVDIFPTGTGYDFVSQYEGMTEIQEAITLPEADGAEAAFAGSTLASLGGIAGYNLNGNTSVGPGDVTWSLQWDTTIGVGGGFDVFKNKALSVTPIPEPSGLALIALGLSVWGLARRRH